MPIAVIDADRHVAEPISLWQEYLPERFKSCAPRYVHTKHSSNLMQDEVSVLYLFDQPLLNKFSPQTQTNALVSNAQHGDPHRAAADSQEQLTWMDKQGIDAAAIFPSLAPYCVFNNRIDAELSRAFAQAYNCWLYDYCAKDRRRLKGVALISRHDPETMLADLDIILKQGWRTLAMRSEPIHGRPLNDAAYMSFWQACESAQVSLAFHGGTHLQAPTVGSDRFISRFALHACSHPMEAQIAFLSLLENGTLETCPHLKLAFLEAGCSWLPHWLWRLDQICYAESRNELRNVVKLLPSEYFKRQCWVGFEVDEPCISEVINMVGVERLLFGTDFPHPDHLHLSLASFDNPDHPLASLRLSQGQLEQLLQNNPCEFFNLALASK